MADLFFRWPARRRARFVSLNEPDCCLAVAVVPVVPEVSGFVVSFEISVSLEISIVVSAIISVVVVPLVEFIKFSVFSVFVEVPFVVSLFELLRLASLFVRDVVFGYVLC